MMASGSQRARFTLVEGNNGAYLGRLTKFEEMRSLLRFSQYRELDERFGQATERTVFVRRSLLDARTAEHIDRMSDARDMAVSFTTSGRTS